MPRGINQFDEDRLDGLNFGDANSSNIVSPGIVTDGLVLHLDAGNYQSYPIAGTTWYDLSGYRNNGTLTNGPTYARVGGGAIVFDGTNDYVDLPSDCINSNADLTLSFWVAPEATVGQIRTLISTTGFEHLQCRFDNNQFRIVRSNIIDIKLFTGTTFIVDGVTFSNAVLTLVKATNTWSLYKNGVFVESFVSAQTFATNDPVIGSNTSAEWLKGKFSVFHYYNRALSASEVSQNFNALRARFNI